MAPKATRKIQKRDADFIFEMSALRRLPRMWQRFFPQNVANNAEHSFRVAWLALMIAVQEGEGDQEKILKMALVHDLPEGRSSDVDYMARQYVTRHDEKAQTDMFHDTTLGEQMLPILNEYRERTTIESKIVKDADMLDQDIEIQELAHDGNQTVLPWKKSHIAEKQRKCYTKSGRALQLLIYRSNPASWHHNSPMNRFNGGDWKQPKRSKKVSKG